MERRHLLNCIMKNGRKISTLFMLEKGMQKEDLEVFDIITIDIESSGLYPSPTPEMIANGVTEDYIVAIGCMDEFGMQIFSAPFDTYKISLELAEKECINAFSNYFLKYSEGQSILSYNGIGFDVPFVSSKFLKTKLETHANTSSLLFDTPHIDLMGYARFVTGRRLSKDDACRKLANLYVPRKSEGLWNARIYKNPQLLTENDHLEMLQHNATDLTATARLYNVVKHFPDFAAWRLKEANGHEERRKQTP